MPHTANRNFSPTLGARFDAFFAELGGVLAAKDLSADRIAAAVRLDRRSDAALDAMGIARADIPRIVFSDLFTF